MAAALAAAGCARGMEPVLPRLAEQVREAITAQRGRKGAASCPEALQVRKSPPTPGPGLGYIPGAMHYSPS
jgi:hypothetical protein